MSSCVVHVGEMPYEIFIIERMDCKRMVFDVVRRSEEEVIS